MTKIFLLSGSISMGTVIGKQHGIIVDMFVMITQNEMQGRIDKLIMGCEREEKTTKERIHLKAKVPQKTFIV